MTEIRMTETKLCLLHRIHRKFQTTTQILRFGALEFSFTRITNPDRVLDDVILEEDRLEKVSGLRVSDPPHLPYWAELWDSSIALASVLCRMELSDCASVLDLGCGMGLAGTAAAAGGGRVLLADLEPPALLLARYNTLPFAPRVRSRCLNWQTDRLPEQFDLIVGADIVYEKSQWPFLDAFWKAHLSSNGHLLLAEPNRPSGDVFIGWIAGQGWRVTPAEELIAGKSKPIRVMELRRL